MLGYTSVWATQMCGALALILLMDRRTSARLCGCGVDATVHLVFQHEVVFQQYRTPARDSVKGRAELLMITMRREREKFRKFLCAFQRRITLKTGCLVVVVVRP